MFPRRSLGLVLGVLGTFALGSVVIHAVPRKPHIVVLGAAKQVPYSKAGDPAGAAAGRNRVEDSPPPRR